MERKHRLYMYTVYDSPLDYPGKFVVRGWVATMPPTPDAEPLSVTGSLEEARASLPPGLIRLPRMGKDEPQIVESWV